ncbi:MAG: peptide chain release factor N(5)-glutamine methyltransferase [Planctomycetota bacterium]
MTRTTHHTRRPIADPPWTTRRLLEWMSGHFAERGIDSPRVVAEMLLAHVLDCDRLRLYMESDRPASEPELARLRALVRRAVQHEPAQYLVGEAWFFGRAFSVAPATLIPRPSTEVLVEAVLQRNRDRGGGEPPRIADLCTGTGCIAVSLAAQIPGARIVATDVVPEALDLAGRNAARHGVADRIELRAGSLLEPLGDEPFDVICANPPYVPDEEWEQVEANVREHEPAGALRAGPDGLQFIRPLIAGAGRHLRPGGRLFIEIPNAARDTVLALASSTDDLERAEVRKDYDGHWRLLAATRRDEP